MLVLITALYVLTVIEPGRDATVDLPATNAAPLVKSKALDATVLAPILALAKNVGAVDAAEKLINIAM
jgi:hypothetical protein